MTLSLWFWRPQPKRATRLHLARGRPSLLSAVATALVVFATSSSGFAQAMAHADMALPKPIGTIELARFLDSLGADDAQRGSSYARHAVYKDDYEDVREPEKRRLADLLHLIDRSPMPPEMAFLITSGVTLLVCLGSSMRR